MAAIGNLNDYVKHQMTKGLGHRGSAGMTSELAVGIAMAQEMIKGQGGILGAGQATAAPPAAAMPVLPNLMTPVQVSQALSVSEADVMVIIGSGKLKAKKSALRIAF
tara:strand:- start:122 stop:442 length:321 start_codon:yes stop_codon:yes gene_type:complete